MCPRLDSYRTGGANVQDRHACAVAVHLYGQSPSYCENEINQHEQQYKHYYGCAYGTDALI
jgi:hypothetical protein